MEFKKILWPTDFSRNAAKALPIVDSLTKKYDAELHMLYVFDTTHLEPWYDDLGKDQTDSMLDRGRELGQRRLERICSKYLQDCPEHTRHTAMGNPAQEILKFIDQEEVDLVVMPTHGERGVFPFGSVTEKVVKNSPVPVLTVPIQIEMDEKSAGT
ncbi:MAG: universal stress protein [Desulfobacteraceae bacterium]|jgi:nucleotide-binding universal stress UspA family protein